MSPLQRVGRWISEHIIMGIGLLVLIYMFIPIAIVVAMSFNDPPSRNNYSFGSWFNDKTPGGFTLDNWKDPCAAQGMCDSVVRSVQIGLLATLGAT